MFVWDFDHDYVLGFNNDHHLFFFGITVAHILGFSYLMMIIMMRCIMCNVSYIYYILDCELIALLDDDTGMEVKKFVIMSAIILPLAF